MLLHISCCAALLRQKLMSLEKLELGNTEFYWLNVKLSLKKVPSCSVSMIRNTLYSVSFSNRSLCFLTDPNVLFLVDSLIYGKEDSDILLVCPLTDPDVLNFTLRKCDGKPLPKNMTFIPNPQKGIIIKNVQRSFKGCYQCLAKHNGVEKISEHIFLNVRPGNTGVFNSCRAPDFHFPLGPEGRCSDEKLPLVY